LAGEGVLFRNAFAAGPETVTSVSSFLTSTPIPFARNDSPTIVESLKANADYNTVGVNPNVQIIHGHCKNLNLIRGFDIYDTMLGGTRRRFEAPVEALASTATSQLTHHSGHGGPIARLAASLIAYAPFPLAAPAPRAWAINSRALTYLQRVQEPFFLWLFYLDVHEPYLPSQRSRSALNRLRSAKLNRKRRYFKERLSQKEIKDLSKLYRESVQDLDVAVGRLVQALADRDLYDDLTVIFTADHGEQFGEHGEVGHPAQLYDEQLHVPLIVKPRGCLPERVEVDHPVSLLDLGPTIAKVAGLAPDTRIASQVLPLSSKDVSAQSTEQPVIAFGDVAGTSYSYRRYGWKLIWSKRGKELYDLRTDPGETINRYPEHREVAPGLEKEGCDYLRELARAYQTLPSEKRRIRRIAGRLLKASTPSSHKASQ
jgi:arylsulfatase A-like enzyme